MQGRFNAWKHPLQTELAAEGTFPAGLSYLFESSFERNP